MCISESNLTSVMALSTDVMVIIIKNYGISKKMFATYNEVDNSHKIIPGIPYYFSKKRKRGRVESYFKGSDQSLWQVSQLFGVQLKSLKKVNKGNNSDRVLLRRRFNLL